MIKMKKFLLNMLSDGSEISIKRVITLIAFILLGIAFLLNLGFDIKVSEKLLDIMENLVMFGFGGTVVEKFAKKTGIIPSSKTDSSNNEDPVIN